MYPSMKIIRTNQNRALRKAHAQPLESSSPNRTRRRVRVVPGYRAVWAMTPLLDLERALHRRRVDLAEERVRPGLQRGHGVRLLLGPLEERRVPHRDGRPGGIVDDDVV